MAYANRRSYSGASAACTLTSSITSGDTTVTLTGTTTLWPDTANGSFFMVIDPGLSTEEKILVGARAGGSLSSITRGVDGTTAASHSAGATCYPVFTAVDADQANKITSTLTTKGDILATDGSDLNRLAVGTNDYALLADSAATNGVAWKQIPAAGLASDSVTTAKILNSNVTAAKLATDSVETAKIVDANVTTAKLADKSVTSAKLGPITSSGIGASWTFALVNAESVISYTGAGAATATIPPESSVAWPNGTQLNVIQYGGGQVTFTAGAGVTINSEGSKFKTKAQWAIATAIKIDTNFWVVVGNLAA
jgi:hypothetical protein